MSNVDLLSSLDYRIKRYEVYKNIKNDIGFNLINIEKEIDTKNKDLIVIQDSATYYKKSQDILYEKSIGALKSLIDSALKFIFYDKNYEIIIELEDKRGNKSLTLKLKDLQEDFEVSLKNGCGNGVRSVISSILNLFVILNKGSDFLLLDEKYSHISADYISPFMEFLNKLCESRNLTVVLITHDERFLPFSKKTYRVTDGRVEEVISA